MEKQAWNSMAMLLLLLQVLLKAMLVIKHSKVADAQILRWYVTRLLYYWFYESIE